MIFRLLQSRTQIPTPRLALWRIRRHRPARHHDLHRCSFGTNNLNGFLYLFGAFLLYTGIHMMKPEAEAEAEEDLSQNKILTLLKKVIPTSQQFDGENSLPSKTANVSLRRFCWY